MKKIWQKNTGFSRPARIFHLFNCQTTVQNRKASEKHYRRIEEYAPKTGIVRLLRLTEKQYNNIYMVAGEPDYQEKVVGTSSHIML